MNSKQILDFIKHPAKLQKSEAEELQRVTEEYPYSGLLHALYLKALKNQNNYLYPKQLKRTAITVPDRKILYYWTEGEHVAELEETLDKPTLVFKAEEKKAPDTPKVEATPAKEETSIIEKTPAAPVTPQVVSKPKEPVKAAETTKTKDIDLAGLPASVRETVLRARRIREQIGKKYDDENAEPKPESSGLKQEAIPEQEEVSIAESPKVEEPSEPLEVAVTPEPTQAPEPEKIEEPTEEEQEPILEVEFTQVVEEKVTEEEPEPIPESQPERPEVEMHSFLDWLSGAESDEQFSEKSEIETNFELETEPDIQSEKEELASEDVLREQESLDAEEQTGPIDTEEKPSTEQVKEMYDTFMESRPKTKLSFRAEGKPVDAASLGTSPYSQYITETLAQIYVKQKLYDRALNAYEILRLKYPEKSGFFAGRIAEIKQILNENN